MVIPVCGYGGHRRGDRSQNFFGKSFRDTAIQSKFLEREMKPIKKAWKIEKNSDWTHIRWFQFYNKTLVRIRDRETPCILKV